MRIIGLRNFRMGERTKKRLLRIASALLAIVLILFAFYHLTNTGEREIRTMLVTEDAVEETLHGEALLFRTETPLVANHEGLTVPLVPEGAHVPKDTALVSVYGSGAEYTASYRAVSATLERLEAAKREGDVISDLLPLASEAETVFRLLTDALEQGNAQMGREQIEQLRILECRMEALKRDDFSLGDLIAALRSQLDAMRTSSGNSKETLSSPVGGYYYANADSFASLCDPAKIDALTGAELASILQSVRSGSDQRFAGTLVTDSEWFIAVPIAAESIAKVQLGSVCSVIFSDNGGTRIPMTLVRIAEGSDTASPALIFSTRRMPQDFSFSRLQNVHVVTDTAEGFSVPTQAIHTLDGYTGVYVLEGNVVTFCRAEILRDLGVRAIVKATDPTPSGEFTENTYRYIALYDAMILSGGDLYHGRVLS